MRNTKFLGWFLFVSTIVLEIVKFVNQIHPFWTVDVTAYPQFYPRTVIGIIYIAVYAVMYIAFIRVKDNKQVNAAGWVGVIHLVASLSYEVILCFIPFSIGLSYISSFAFILVFVSLFLLALGIYNKNLSRVVWVVYAFTLVNFVTSLIINLIAVWANDWENFLYYSKNVYAITYLCVKLAYLVFFLMLANGGGFGKDSETRTLYTRRGLGKYILFSILTMGVYQLAVYCRLGNEANIRSSAYDNKKTIHYLWAGLLACLTLGIYAFVWSHQLCNRMEDELKRRHINYEFSAADFWLWNILGSLVIIGPFVFVHRLMKTGNMLNASYNMELVSNDI